MAAILERGGLSRDVQLADDCLRDALAASPMPFLEALDAGLEDAGERFHALRLLKGLPGWESKEVSGDVDGRRLVERLAREDPDRQAQGMALELLGGPGRERLGMVSRYLGFEGLREP